MKNYFHAYKKGAVLVQELEQNIKRAISLRGTNGSQSTETDYMEMMNTLTKYIVDLHGEMVLLINYCNINYTGTFSS